jgi:hypothetical protein
MIENNAIFCRRFLFLSASPRTRFLLLSDSQCFEEYRQCLPSRIINGQFAVEEVVNALSSEQI